MAPCPAGTDLLLVPSYSADPRTLAGIDGLDSWTERHLIELRHLLQPGNRLVLVTPTPISEPCLDAVLKLIPAVPATWLRERLHLLCLNDQAQLRPGALLGCYAVSSAEMALAERLGLKLEGTPASLAELGSKAGAAAVFAQLGLPHPRTTPLCMSLVQLADACEALLLGHENIQQLVVKLNRMSGGRGNAPLQLDPQRWRCQQPGERRLWLQQALERLAMPLPHWQEELQGNGAIAQELIQAPPGALSSPSVQLWIDPDGAAAVVSTHEQRLGGPHGQSFRGCRFPARQLYTQKLMTMGQLLGEHLAGLGCRGAVLLDLLARREGSHWRLWAIEINLRKGGNTHPFQLAASATGARFDRASGLLRCGDGAAVFYEASDELRLPHWRGLLPDQLLDDWVRRGLYFNSTCRSGCIPHRLGALSQHGMLGVTVVGRGRREASELMRQLRSEPRQR